MYVARSSAQEKSSSISKAFFFRGFAPTALRPTPGRCRGSFSSGPLKTWRDRRCRFYPATTTRCPMFLWGGAPAAFGLPWGVVVVRFHRGFFFRGFAPTALRPTPGRCRGSFSSGLFFQGLRPYGLSAYPRALSWFVFIGAAENVAGSAMPILSRHHHSVPDVFLWGGAPAASGLPPGVVVVRFHRGR